MKVTPVEGSHDDPAMKLLTVNLTASSRPITWNPGQVTLPEVPAPGPAFAYSAKYSDFEYAPAPGHSIQPLEAMASSIVDSITTALEYCFQGLPRYEAKLCLTEEKSELGTILQFWIANPVFCPGSDLPFARITL